MAKIDRKTVYDKYGGRCAYCGDSIEFKKFQVDHLHPKCRSHQKPDEDENRMDNLMPSCPKCNNHKHGFRLEEWRRELQSQVTRLKKNTQFQRALRCHQVLIIESPIVFYFEDQQVNICNGCIHHHPGSNLYSGSNLCTLDAGNNCVRRAEDYYTPKDKQ